MDVVYEAYWYVLLGLMALGVVFYATALARVVPGLWMTSSRFNSTNDWMPPPDYGHAPLPRYADPIEKSLRIIHPTSKGKRSGATRASAPTEAASIGDVRSHEVRVVLRRRIPADLPRAAPQ